ncbi:MAG: 23S rRNA (guanosine(2251)-2'-O)-methyltransferase RlmB [Bacilli bacterium]
MLVYGKNVFKEIPVNQMNKIYLVDNFNDRDILSKIKKSNITYVTKNELDKMVDGNHQGIACEITDYYYYDIDDILKKEKPFLVMLDHLEDPHNFGAIIRSCEAAGVDGIIIAKNRSVSVNSTVMKVSAGSLQNVKIAMVTNLVNTIKKLKEQNFTVIGTDMQGTDYKAINYQEKICLVIGNEGKGISRLVKENIDIMASIPMKGTINSLNASVATAIIVFEATYQRK